MKRGAQGGLCKAGLELEDMTGRTVQVSGIFLICSQLELNSSMLKNICTHKKLYSIAWWVSLTEFSRKNSVSRCPQVSICPQESGCPQGSRSSVSAAAWWVSYYRGRWRQKRRKLAGKSSWAQSLQQVWVWSSSKLLFQDFRWRSNTVVWLRMMTKSRGTK